MTLLLVILLHCYTVQSLMLPHGRSVLLLIHILSRVAGVSTKCQQFPEVLRRLGLVRGDRDPRRLAGDPQEWGRGLYLNPLFFEGVDSSLETCHGRVENRKTEAGDRRLKTFKGWVQDCSQTTPLA